MIKGKTAAKKSSKKPASKKAISVFRTRSAGVHYGALVSRKGLEAIVSEARRIWYWTGANTLTEIANHGVAAGSKISEPSNQPITLTEVIEVLPCSAKAIANLDAIGWAK